MAKGQARRSAPVDRAAGQETLAAVASKAEAWAAAMIKKAKAVARRTKKVATRARPKSTLAMARVTHNDNNEADSAGDGGC